MRDYRITVFQEGSQWVAECKELEIAAQGPTIYEALESLGILFSAKGVGAIPELTVH